MRIALVHDDFMQNGGAENLFATIASIYKDAPIYTSLADWQKLPSSIDRGRIKTSFLQKIPLARSFYKALLPLYPFAFETFNFDDFDLVISSTTRFSKSIITRPQTLHISYINSIPRFLYSDEVQKEYLNPFFSWLFKPFFNWLKKWDKVASTRPDFYIANSQNVKESVKKEYGVDSAVVYPYVDTKFFKPAKIHNWQLKSEKYFLIVSRLVKWKKIEIAIKTAKNLNINLKIIGDGPDDNRLKRLVASYKRLDNKSIEFLGHVKRERLLTLYQNCQALIITQEEDFGIAAAEAQACARPVIAFARGGQREIIKEDKTGIFFKSKTPDSLKDAISYFFKLKWSESVIRRNSLRFSKARFEKNLLNVINLYASRSQRS